MINFENTSIQLFEKRKQKFNIKLPKIKKVEPKLVADEIVPVQPMSRPTGFIPTHGNIYNETTRNIDRENLNRHLERNASRMRRLMYKKI